MPKNKEKNVLHKKQIIVIALLFLSGAGLLWYLRVIQPQKNNRRQVFTTVQERPRYQEPTSTPEPTPITSTGERYTSESKRISLVVPTGWIITKKPWISGVVIEIQGPHQLLKIYEDTQPDHGFDDFKTQTTTMSVAGKSFAATQFTSQSWGNSFISVQIQTSPYELYLEYGDAASVGFRGFEQKYDEKVNFDKDVQPISNILRTLKY